MNLYFYQRHLERLKTFLEHPIAKAFRESPECIIRITREDEPPDTVDMFEKVDGKWHRREIKMEGLGYERT